MTVGIFKKKPVEVAGLEFDHGLSRADVEGLDRLAWDESHKGDLYHRIGDAVGTRMLLDNDRALRVYAVVALLHTESGEAIEYFRDKVFDLSEQISRGSDDEFADAAGGREVVAAVSPHIVEWLLLRDSIETGSEYRDRAATFCGTLSQCWPVDGSTLVQLAARFPDQDALWRAPVNGSGKRLLEPLIG